MPKSPTDNNILQESVPVEEVLDDNIAIAVSKDLKTQMIVAARQHVDERGRALTVSEWGREVLMAALVRTGGGVRLEDRRSA